MFLVVLFLSLFTISKSGWIDMNKAKGVRMSRGMYECICIHVYTVYIYVCTYQYMYSHGPHISLQYGHMLLYLIYLYTYIWTQKFSLPHLSRALAGLTKTCTEASPTWFEMPEATEVRPSVRPITGFTAKKHSIIMCQKNGCLRKDWIYKKDLMNICIIIYKIIVFSQARHRLHS